MTQHRTRTNRYALSDRKTSVLNTCDLTKLSHTTGYHNSGEYRNYEDPVVISGIVSSD
jgi:hypothetical protein